jgi:hypothetical protein
LRRKSQFEVIKPVKLGDLVVIPEHATAAGTVLLAEKKSFVGRGGKLAITMSGCNWLPDKLRLSVR